MPGLAMVRLRRVSLERRQGNLEMAEALLQEAIQANEGLPLASFYAIKLARQVLKVQKNLIKARKVLMDALEKDPVRDGAGSGHWAIAQLGLWYRREANLCFSQGH